MASTQRFNPLHLTFECFVCFEVKYLCLELLARPPFYQFHASSEVEFADY